MKTKAKTNPLCPYRLIGRVQIVDLIPRLVGAEGQAWLEVMERHFFRGLQRAVVVNVSHSLEMEETHLRRLMLHMERPLKIAFYTNSPEKARGLVLADYVNERRPLLSHEEEVVNHFGLDLIERDKDTVSSKERRRYKRFKVVMPAEVILKEKGSLVTKAIVTNISEGGAFLQYLDLEASLKMAGLRDNPRVPVEVILKHQGSSECELAKGYIIRVDMLGQQRGIAVRFVPSLANDSLLVSRFKKVDEADKPGDTL